MAAPEKTDEQAATPAGPRPNSRLRTRGRWLTRATVSLLLRSRSTKEFLRGINVMCAKRSNDCSGDSQTRISSRRWPTSSSVVLATTSSRTSWPRMGWQS